MSLCTYSWGVEGKRDSSPNKASAIAVQKNPMTTHRTGSSGTMNPAEVERVLAEDVAQYVHDPLGFSYYAFPWGKGDLQGSDGPRKWQRAILRAIGDHLQNKQTRHEPCQIALSSGKGIGKSALVGMIIDWAMSTCEDCKIVLTANTDGQLRTKTWPEVSKWFKLTVNKRWFSVEAESITIRNPEHKRLWRCDRIAWTEHNTEAFAGLHNLGKRILIIFDEASAIADKIWEVTDGALTDENTKIIWLAFGNPTRTDGRFRECFGKFKHRWKGYQIDSREVEGTNKAEFQRQVEDYGEDSDHVRIWVRGEFPSASSTQFIPSDIVAAARKYKAQGYERLPKILSVDVARFGDDQTVIGWRQGRKAVILLKKRGWDTVQVAERVIEFMEKEKPDATVVDGDGLGAGVVDQIRHRRFGHKLFEFHGAQKANDVDKYFNRRAEVWGLMRDWLMAGAEIPDDPELEADLVGPEYLYSRKQQIQLEKKEDMKSRGLASPDCGDMLAMRFSVKVAPPPPKPKTRHVHPAEQETAWMA